MIRRRLARLGELLRHRLRTFSSLSRGDAALIDALRARHLTYLSGARLQSLAMAARRVEAAGLRGIFVEAGCALGGSTILLARTKSRERPLVVYDVFATIPAPTAADPPEVHARYEEIATGRADGIGGERYYGYRTDLLHAVGQNLESFGVEAREDRVRLVKGLIHETMSIDDDVALAHIDVDWYEPVRTCLERIVPKLVPGGVLIIDDYEDWGGCRIATDEYFNGRRGDYRFERCDGSLVVRRAARRER